MIQHNYERERRFLDCMEKYRDRFWTRIISTGFCWRYKAQPSTAQGRFYAAGGPIIPSRISWMMNFGAIPKGMLVCHRCDHPRCVNPAHLFLGTMADDMQDCARKGRLWTQKTPQRSFLHHWNNRERTKLKTEQIPEIKRLRSTGLTLKAIGKLYGVSRTLIGRIMSGEVVKFFTIEEIEALQEIQ